MAFPAAAINVFKSFKPRAVASDSQVRVSDIWRTGYSASLDAGAGLLRGSLDLLLSVQDVGVLGQIELVLPGPLSANGHHPLRSTAGPHGLVHRPTESGAGKRRATGCWDPRYDQLFGRFSRLFDQRRNLFGMREKCDMASR